MVSKGERGAGEGARVVPWGSEEPLFHGKRERILRPQRTSEYTKDPVEPGCYH